MQNPSFLIILLKLVFAIAFVNAALSAQEKALAEIQKKEDLRQYEEAFFEEHLTHPFAWIRERAAIALGRIQSKGSHLLLLKVLKSEEDLRVLEALLFAGGQFQEESLLSVLLNYTTHAHPTIRATAFEALGKTPLDVALKEAYFDHELGKSLQKGLKDLSPEVRLQSVLALFRHQAKGSLPLLQSLYPQEPSDEVRWRILYTLASFKEKEAYATLIQGCSDSHPYARLFALRGLAFFAQENPPHPDWANLEKNCLNLLEDPFLWVAWNALKTLQSAEHTPLPSTLLEKLLQSPHSHLRSLALESCRTFEHVPLLFPLLQQDPSPQVKQKALLQLTQIAPSLGASFFEEFQHSSSPFDRATLVSALAFLPKPRQKRWQNALLLDPAPQVRSACIETLFTIQPLDERIFKALDDPDLAVRGTAVSELTDRFKNYSTEEQKILSQALEKTYRASTSREFYEIREAILKILPLDPSPAPPVVEASPFLQTPLSPTLKIEIQTTRGILKLKLFPQEAPLHVAHFLDLITKGFYENLLFHRVVPAFVVQGGDPRGDGWGDSGDTLRDEINRHLYVRGTLGMPKAGKDTGGCQLFITPIPTPHLDGRYTVFGQLLSGFEVLDQLEIGDRILQISLLK